MKPAANGGGIPISTVLSHGLAWSNRKPVTKVVTTTAIAGPADPFRMNDGLILRFNAFKSALMSRPAERLVPAPSGHARNMHSLQATCIERRARTLARTLSGIWGSVIKQLN